MDFKALLDMHMDFKALLDVCMDFKAYWMFAWILRLIGYAHGF